MFEEDLFDPFDDLLMGKCHEITNVTNIVACINQKLAENVENPERLMILSEVLNDIKLLMIPVSTEH